MKRKIFGGVKFEIKTVNQERFFSTLSKSTPIFDVKRKSTTQVEFKTNFKNAKTAKEIIGKHNAEVTAQKGFGLFPYVISFFKQIGLVAGLVFGIILGFISTNFVFQTQILGLENLTRAEIVEVLKEKGATGIAFKGKINTKILEQTLTSKLDKISLVSVIIKGNTLVISVKEKLYAGDYDNLDGMEALKATESGIITEIKLIQGTLKVKIGDTVKAGDILVEPYILDSGGNVKKVKAEAEIKARVWYVGRENHFEKRFESVKTGKTLKHTNLYFMGINLTSPLPQNVFISYEITVTKKTISYNNFLPIIRETILLEETKQVQIEEKFDTVKDKIFLKAKEKALKLVGEYEIIKREYSTINQTKHLTTVEYVVEVEKNIS